MNKYYKTQLTLIYYLNSLVGTRWHSPTSTTSIINKARHEFYTKFMEENSKDQGKLFRAVKRLLTAENKLSFYGMIMKYFKFQQLHVVAIQTNIYEHFDGEIQISEQTG